MCIAKPVDSVDFFRGADKTQAFPATRKQLVLFYINMDHLNMCAMKDRKTIYSTQLSKC